MDGREIELAGALPLGIAGGGQYQAMNFNLAPGSRLTFMTDGVVEARNRQGELFGFDRTRLISTEPAAAIAEAAVNFGQSDDITVLTIERLLS
jgi:serine phosphatase RsbU (regulator of sigma subunit)